MVTIWYPITLVEGLILFNHQFDGLYVQLLPSAHVLVELEQVGGLRLRLLDYG